MCAPMCGAPFVVVVVFMLCDILLFVLLMRVCYSLVVCGVVFIMLMSVVLSVCCLWL